VRGSDRYELAEGEEGFAVKERALAAPWTEPLAESLLSRGEDGLAASEVSTIAISVDCYPCSRRAVCKGFIVAEEALLRVHILAYHGNAHLIGLAN
jgi:hypothetical protein